MGLIVWVVFGLIAGAIAKLIMPGKDPGGVIVTIGLGIAGAVVGGLVSTLLGFGSVSGFNLPSLFVAVAGALILLIGYRLLKKRTLTLRDANAV